MTAYDAVVGTGGIGTGIVFALDSDHTIGREESRAADLLDSRDYAKLHIVCHYLRKLLGPEFPVVPIGAVGADDRGTGLLDEFHTTGLDATYVRTDTSHPTLFAVCFSYPSGEGGNLTSRNSASSSVGPADVRAALPVFLEHRGKGIALALPEVPIAARSTLLDLATDHGFLRVTAFVSGEAEQARSLLDRTDLVAINLDEARALARTAATDPVDIVGAVVDAYPKVDIVVTAGKSGSWAWDGVELVHAPALPAVVASTAGAGDAYLAGLVTALVRGERLHDATTYGAVVAMLKVASRHTINPDITAESVAAAITHLG
ncbi:carbohydrate kinase family protein [Fodinicola acaciae]|uniref:carbohydrate kinase family protein n=1 Tax=Fodinicola acaciae TaxID=2681555 RepID=UPI0013D8D518|nr:PfkB family carbohydrate kinase [Fodinicola acaciae]